LHIVPDLLPFVPNKVATIALSSRHTQVALDGSAPRNRDGSGNTTHRHHPLNGASKLTTSIEAAETASNALTKQGKIIDSLDQFYADNCVFIESDGSRRQSKKDQRAHLEGFFATLKSFESATLHGQSVGNNVSMSEWTFKMTGGDDKQIVWNEVLVRGWEDGRIVSEKYYQQS
jgi:ketosteroid isomerase-like protein